MSVGGTFECVTASPMGDQKGTFIVIPSEDGASFTGTMSGPAGPLEVQDGKIDSNRLTWKMDMTVPFAMTLEGDVTVDGDDLSGSVKAGMMGAMAVTGTRAG